MEGDQCGERFEGMASPARYRNARNGSVWRLAQPGVGIEERLAAPGLAAAASREKHNHESSRVVTAHGRVASTRRVAGDVRRRSGLHVRTLTFASIGPSDTSTDALVTDGLIFVLLGIVAIGSGAWLLRRHRTHS